MHRPSGGSTKEVAPRPLNFWLLLPSSGLPRALMYATFVYGTPPFCDPLCPAANSKYKRMLNDNQ